MNSYLPVCDHFWYLFYLYAVTRYRRASPESAALVASRNRAELNLCKRTFVFDMPFVGLWQAGQLRKPSSRGGIALVEVGNHEVGQGVVGIVIREEVVLGIAALEKENSTHTHTRAYTLFTKLGNRISHLIGRLPLKQCPGFELL